MNSNLSPMDLLKKEILYKSLHRGSKECDLVIGGFVRESLETFSHENLLLLRDLVDLDDVQFFRVLETQDPEFTRLLEPYRLYRQKLSSS